MTDSKEIQFLKQDRIGKVIAKGLASVYEAKPQKPITYFANWLLNHSKNVKEIQSIKTAQDEKKVKLVEHLNLEKEHNDKIEKQAEVRTQVQKKNQEFQSKIQKELYHLQLLVSEFPEFLEKSLGLSGVYVGELNFPAKAITDEDTDENAHLNTEAPKLIKYIGSSKSHETLMKGKTLNADRSVTAEVFVAAAPTTNEEGLEIPGEKPKYVYVPDVVQNQKIHYFKLPKLGAYLAIPLIYKSYLSQATFNFVLEETNKEEKERTLFQADKATHLEQLRSELDDAKAKLDALIEKQGELPPQTNKDQIPQYKQVSDLEQKVAQKEAEQFQYPQAEIVSEIKEFVVCADTLGQDREITAEEREFFLKYVDLFKSQWEECELRLLKEDVENQIKYQKTLRLPITQLIEQITQDIEEFPQSTQNQLQEKYKDNQKLLGFETAAFKLDQIRGKLETQEIQRSFLVLNKFRVVRFPGLIQNILYFLGHKKEEVDAKGTTHLNWKYVRQNLINQSLIRSTISYDYRGPKHQEFKNYEKIDTLLTALQKYPEDQVLEYNIGLGMILKFIKAALKLRKEDIEIRRAKIDELKKKREEKQKENQAIQEEKQSCLQKHKASLAPQELEGFNEQQWILGYEQEHPFAEIPPEVNEDIDNDI